MSTTVQPDKLREHRPVLLACEAIGWFHMLGKARIEFLRIQGGEAVDYKYEKWHEYQRPPFPWDELLGWVREFDKSAIPQHVWPASIEKLIEEHKGKKNKEKKNKEENSGVLGLLQAAHGITSGIEKNVSPRTSEHLEQSIVHMWLSSPFGYPKRNLLAFPPETLIEDGWNRLVDEVRCVLEELKSLAFNYSQNLPSWISWREKAIGVHSFLRRALLSTLAETRVPINDVTLWDQSYVTAALFKSAVAGALLYGNFPWDDQNIKQKIQWRLLTVAICADHYEARAVKIGDLTGARRVLDEFFDRVAQLVEVDLAVGSLLYRDESVVVFSFPGEPVKGEKEKEKEGKKGESVKEGEQSFDEWRNWFQNEVERLAEELRLETPPFVQLSPPTRSLVPMAYERRKTREITMVPLHKTWEIKQEEDRGNICPVCRVRLNGDPRDRNKPCKVCEERRRHRRNDWLSEKSKRDTIWFEEVADRNDRIALLTISLDLEPWLSGERVDSLRVQAIPEWIRFNPTLSGKPNPIDIKRPFESLKNHVLNLLSKDSEKIDKNDQVLQNLQEGYKYEECWQSFFNKIVEDRAEAPGWNELNNEQRATWITHQLFCKLPSPGRVYRFWREAQGFFEELLREFRGIASCSENPWRVRRLFLKPDSTSGWKDLTLYNGRWRGSQISLFYVRELGGFITASNLARLLKPEERREAFQNQQILLEEEDVYGETRTLIVTKVEEVKGNYAHLGYYYPVIPLELSPQRFRVILPLETVSECVDLALSRWEEYFARVWDRLPIRIGIVAFDRTLAFQAVIEATRNLEDKINRRCEETWRVEQKVSRDGIVTLQFRRGDDETTMCSIPVKMPDGRTDVFYPYVAVEDRALRYPLDFQHPNGQVYRHVSDLKLGDGVRVYPARVSFVFMSNAGDRFEISDPFYAEDWKRIREVWKLIKAVAPSQTALQRFQSSLLELEEAWRTSPEKPSSELWYDTLKGLIAKHLGAKGTVLETLTEMAVKGFLLRALEWHLTALKESVEGGSHNA